jgi:hypothetical protein
MRGPRWAEVRLALTELSKEAMQYDADGIEICFMNSRSHKESIKVGIILSSCGILDKYSQIGSSRATRDIRHNSAQRCRPAYMLDILKTTYVDDRVDIH